MNLFDLAAKISLDSTTFESGLNSAKKAVGTFGKIATATFAAGSAAFVAFSKNAVSTGAEFDTAMSQVAATMGVTADEIKDLRDFAKEMGASTKFSATESAQALNYMALAGYDATKSMEMLPTVLNLAAAGGMELARASDMVTDAESALGLTSKETAAMVDQMAKTASKSNTSVEQLGDAMLTIGGTAQFMAGGTDRLQTVLGLLADNGIKGAEAGTHLRNMLLKLSSPTKEGADTLNALGVKVFDASGNMRDMQNIIQDLGEAMKNLTQEEKVTAISNIFNARDLSAVNALLGTSTDRWNELGSAIASAQGSAEQMAETQLDNLTGDITIMKSALEGVKIEFSEGIMPSLRQLVQNVTKWLSNPKTMKFISELGEKTGALATKILDWGQRVIPYVIQAVKAVAPVVKNVFGAASGIVRELATKAFGVFIKALESVQKVLPKVGEWFKRVLDFGKSLLPSLKNIAQVVGNLAKTALPIVVNLVKKLAPIIKTVFDITGRIAKAVGPLLEKVLTHVGKVLNTVVGDIGISVKLLTPLISVVKGLAKVLEPVVSMLTKINDVVDTILGPARKFLGIVGDFFGMTADQADGVDKAAKAVEKFQESLNNSGIDFSAITDRMRENRDAANDVMTAYAEMNQQFGESYNETQKEVGHIQDLWQELRTLAGATGEVNEADAERAHFIAQELESLTGLEIEWNGNVIQSYKDIAEAIDDVIQKKKASKLIEIAEQKADQAQADIETASAGIYTEKQSIADYEKQIAEINRRYDLSDEVAQMRLLQEQLGQYVEENGKWYSVVKGIYGEELSRTAVDSKVIEGINSQIKALEPRVKEVRKTADEQISAINDSIASSEENIANYERLEMESYANIADYEKAYAEYARGHYGEVADMLEDDVLNHWKRTTSIRKLSEDELKNLKDEYNTRLDQYKRINEAYLRGEAWATAEAVKEAKKRADEVFEAYRMATVNGSKDLYDASRLLGIDFSRGFEDGLKSMAQQLAKMAGDVARGAASAMRNTLQIKSPSRVTREIGQYFGEGFGLGIMDEADAIEDSVGYVSDSAVNAFGDPEFGSRSGRGGTQSNIEYLLQQILDKMGFDIVLEDGVIAGRVDRIIGQSAMRKARGGA